jgi:hypothetical protein
MTATPDTPTGPLLGCPTWCDTARHATLTDPLHPDVVSPLLHFAELGTIQGVLVQLVQLEDGLPTVLIDADRAVLVIPDDVVALDRLLRAALDTARKGSQP